ncbi:hypothetical protein BH23BAC1_BH23BAC1_23880 [soil metagenome]
MKFSFRLFVAYLFFLIIFTGCARELSQEELEKLCQFQLTEANQELTEVIMNDIFTPPVASRIYAYANIAAYEAMQPGYNSYQSLAGQINGLGALPEPDPDLQYAYPVAAQVAFVEVASQLIYTEEKLQVYLENYLKKIKKAGLSKEVLNASEDYGKQVASHILTWMDSDGYRNTRGRRHTVSGEAGKWQPTAPDFMDGIEPFWDQIRPFALDSANHFPVPNPPAFDTIPESEFYEEAIKVYNAVNNLDEEQEMIARHWDCNPNISFVSGHVKYFKQQLSPGGHWISIACIAAAQANFTAIEHAHVITLASIALADGFISCWHTKYKTDVIRPETYIERYIDKNWRPFLQTPAFPEYTSGHSVISSSAATALASVFGEQFEFTDTSEVSFGLPPRNFTSFKNAYEEAANSRFYGGIHYFSAIKNGIYQGSKVGDLVASQLQFRVNKPVAIK